MSRLPALYPAVIVLLLVFISTQPCLYADSTGWLQTKLFSIFTLIVHFREQSPRNVLGFNPIAFVALLVHRLHFNVGGGVLVSCFFFGRCNSPFFDFSMCHSFSSSYQAGQCCFEPFHNSSYGTGFTGLSILNTTKCVVDTQDIFDSDLKYCSIGYQIKFRI